MERKNHAFFPHDQDLPKFARLGLYRTSGDDPSVAITSDIVLYTQNRVISLRGRKKITSGKNFLLTPPPSIFSDIKKSGKGQEKFSVARALAPRPHVRKVKNRKNFLEASPPDPPKKRKLVSQIQKC